jgi:hypothetical protein
LELCPEVLKRFFRPPELSGSHNFSPKLSKSEISVYFHSPSFASTANFSILIWVLRTGTSKALKLIYRPGIQQLIPSAVTLSAQSFPHSFPK